MTGTGSVVRVRRSTGASPATETPEGLPVITPRGDEGMRIQMHSIGEGSRRERACWTSRVKYSPR